MIINYINYSFLLCLMLNIMGCGSLLKIQSEPSGAEAFVKLQNGIEKKSLGKTPIEISYADLSKMLGGGATQGEYIVLIVENKNFETQSILIPPSTFGNQTSLVQVKMNASAETVNASQILTRLHNAQKFANSSQYERAHIEIDKVLELDNQFVRAISLKGSVYFLQKNYLVAVQWFEKAIAIDPSFEEAIRMITKIKQQIELEKKR